MKQFINRFINGILLNTQLWIWSVAMLSLLVCGLISWIYYQQMELTKQTISTLDQIHQARVGLTKGLLFVSLANDPALPYNREQGIALLNQSLDALENNLKQREENQQNTLDTLVVKKVSLSTFQESVKVFRARQDEWKKFGSQASTETNLRIAFADLEAQADLFDVETREKFDTLSNRLELTFILTLWGAAFGLALICLVVFLAAQTREKAEAEILKLNEELEKRVAERTAQLEITNRELKAFNYSVSHDLRAPLRSISGLSGLFLEDYGNQLGEDQRSYIKRIYEETTRMNNLIDHLLQLSTISNAEIQKEEINISQIAQQVVRRLQEPVPKQLITFSIQPDIIVWGDPHLLEILLTNLISNAVKFSIKNPHPVIEFGKLTSEADDIFFVHDNGVGFDPSRAKHLFEAFQRLHRASEFPGNGIGLTLVRRIAERHGGRVWAESKPAQGATFYFTLDKKQKESLQVNG
jgi:signal transduction histidine kinase